MKKKYLLVIFVLILILLGCSKKNNNINIKFYSQYYPLTNKTELLNNNDVMKLLTASYYENESTALFNTSTLNNFMSIYHLGWTAEILKLNSTENKYNQLYCENLNLKSIDVNKLNLDDLLHYSYGINLCNIDENKNISNRLFDFYDTEEKLFFYTNKNDIENEKFRATFIALNIVDLLNINNIYNDDIYNSLINYYNNITFNSDTESYLVDGGYIILSLLTIKDRPMNFDNNVKNWVKDITSKYIKNNGQYNILEIFDIYYLVILDKYFNNDITSELTGYLDAFLSKNKSIYDLVFQVDSYNADPQYIFKLLFISQHIDYQIKTNLFDNLETYILDNIYSDYSKFNYVNINFEDTFYGIIISNKYNFAFDKTKIINSLNNYKNLFFSESKLPEHKINNLYYFLLISKELKVDLLSNDERERLLDGVYNIISNIDLSVIEIKDIDTLSFSIETVELLNGSLNKEQISQINDKLNILFTNYDVRQSVLTLDIALIQNYLSLSKKISSEYINELLNSLYIEGHYVPINVEYAEEISDIKDTYKVYVISQYYDLNLQNTDLNNYLKSLKDPKFFVKPNKDSNYTNLQTLYYYLLLSSIVV